MYSREIKVKQLIKGVLETTPEFWDNPNGDYRYTCPFCQDYKEVDGSDGISMAEFNHAADCAYLLAKELQIES